MSEKPKNVHTLTLLRLFFNYFGRHFCQQWHSRGDIVFAFQVLPLSWCAAQDCQLSVYIQDPRCQYFVSVHSRQFHILFGIIIIIIIIIECGYSGTMHLLIIQHDGHPCLEQYYLALNCTDAKIIRLIANLFTEKCITFQRLFIATHRTSISLNVTTCSRLDKKVYKLFWRSLPQVLFHYWLCVQLLRYKNILHKQYECVMYSVPSLSLGPQTHSQIAVCTHWIIRRMGVKSLLRLSAVNFEGKPGTCEWKSKQPPKSTRQAGASKSSLDCHVVLT